MGLRRGVKWSLVLLLATLADVYGEVALSTFRKRLWWPGYNPPSIMQAVSRMVKVGEISREMRKGGEVVLHLRAKGGRLLDEALPLRVLQNKRWDGKWRLVIFDIPEKRRDLRDALRLKLRELGFGMWQRSVYVTPHDLVEPMNDFLEARGLFPAAECFESRRIGGGDDRDLADLIFHTQKLNTAYAAILEKADQLRKRFDQPEVSLASQEGDFGTLWMRYFDLLSSDPFLPSELLPKPWFADEAKAALRRLAGALQ